MNKPELVKFFRAWHNETIKELGGKKLTFPDDWPEDFAEKSADYFCEHFEIKNNE